MLTAPSIWELQDSKSTDELCNTGKKHNVMIMKGDKDMIRHMRLLYAKSNNLLRIFSHCTTDVKLILFDSYCTSLYCPFLRTDYTKRTFS